MDFRNKERKALHITFIDEKEIDVFMPNKALFDALIDYQDTATQKKVSVDDMYTISAKLLSRNAQNEVITSEYLENQLDFGDIKDLLTEYTNFVTGAITNPN